MEVMDERLLLGGAALGGRGEQFFEPGLGLPLPDADLIWMNLVLGRDRLDRAVPAERLQAEVRRVEGNSRSSTRSMLPMVPPGCVALRAK